MNTWAQPGHHQSQCQTASRGARSHRPLSLSSSPLPLHQAELVSRYQAAQRQQRIHTAVGGRRRSGEGSPAAGEQQIPRFQVPFRDLTPAVSGADRISSAALFHFLSPLLRSCFPPPLSWGVLRGGSGRKRGRRGGADPRRRRQARNPGALGLPPYREFLISSFSSALLLDASCEPRSFLLRMSVPCVPHCRAVSWEEKIGLWLLNSTIREELYSD